MRVARALEISPLDYLDEPDSWRRAVLLAAAQEVAEQQEKQRKEMDAKRRKK